jgi:ketosteroid isomerase-like protein
MTERDAMVVAERFFAAIGKGDLDAVRAIYAPDAVIWHNNDGVEQNVAQNLAVLAWVVKNISGLRYEDVRRFPTPSGFVQQHVLRGSAPSGVAIEIPACIVCAVANGRITRLDEYLDSAQVAPLLAG